MKFMKVILVVFFALFTSYSSTLAQDASVGILIPLTGPYANVGKECQQGALAAFSSYGSDELSKHVKVITEDSIADPKTALTVMGRLLTNKQFLAVVLIRSGVGLALKSLSEREKVSLLGAVAHPSFTDNPYAFRFWPTTSEEGIAYADDIQSHAYKSVGVVTLEDDYTLALSRETIRELKVRKINVAFDEHSNPDDLDSRALITRVLKEKPEALFVNLGVSQGALFIKRLWEQGYNGAVYSNFWSGSEDAIRVIGKNESPVIFFEPDSNIPDLQRSVAHLGFKERITAATVSCFVATSTLIKALSPLPATRQELYASLARIHEVDLGGYRIPIKDRGAVYRIVPRKVRWGVVSGG